MRDESTGNCIVFNGEIYNFQALRQECERAGDTFRSRSDTEILLALYRRHGIGCLLRLRGMFAIALWDESQQRLFLARDRVGKKPLNYSLTPAGLIFCSELDPLRQHPLVDSGMDGEALELYLQLQYVPAPWSIYRGIRKLPPAHYATFDQTGFNVECYWNVDYREKKPITEKAALDGLEERLTEAVRLRMISDVRLGALLSGGVDSSLVVALMAKLTTEPVQTFSVGFREEAFSELPYAQEAATICRTSHHPEIVAGEVAGLLPAIARHYGEPFADSSAIPSFKVCEIARRHVTVAMNGDGGDELLGGYPRYQLTSLQLGVARLAPDLPLSPGLMRLASWSATADSISGKLSRKAMIEYAWPHLRCLGMYKEFWNDRDRQSLLGSAANPKLLLEWRSGWMRGAMESAENPVDRMLWHDNRTYLPGDLLVKIDIAAMHCGLEARSPLLDHEVIEYCASLPLHFKVKGGVGKYLLKKLAERYFPSRFVHRPKMGFGIPVAEWLRGPLRPALEATLRSPTLMEPLNQTVVVDCLEEFLRGRTDHKSRIWTLFMLGNWRRHIAEGRA
jgi:asparagine synthase (glutamine-hydrolysing)